jgi:hypothetical protein
MVSSWNMSSLQTNEIRLASPSDQVRLQPLIEEYYKFDSLKFDGRTIGRALRRLLRSRTLGRVWVIETVAEPGLVGYAILTYNYDLEFGGVQGIITEFFITEPYRRHGLPANDCGHRCLLSKERDYHDRTPGNSLQRTRERILRISRLQDIGSARHGP